MTLANQLVEHLPAKRFDPDEFEDERKMYVQTVIQRKVQAKQVFLAPAPERNSKANVIFAALETHSDHLKARINLGRLLHLQGNLHHAETVCRAARHSSAMLSFNLAIPVNGLGTRGRGRCCLSRGTGAGARVA
jgi:hypothetical protein